MTEPSPIAWEDVGEAETYDRFIDGLRTNLGASAELYVIAHDLRSLRPLDPATGPPIDDEEILDALLGCVATETGGSTLAPLCSRRFPLLVARLSSDDYEAGRFTRSAGRLGGMFADHQRALLDRIEQLRRPVKMSPAAQLQWDQLPLRAATATVYDIAGTLQPAATVAGDMYDFAVGPGGTACALVMDAMGHGVSATLSAALALAAIRTIRRDGGELADQVAAADEAIQLEYGGDRFVTMVAVELTDDGVHVVNAGHEPLRRGTSSTGVRSLSVPADPPLGLEGLTSYRVTTLDPLAPGEILGMLSDGSTEARDPDGAVFGAVAVDRALSRLVGDATSLQLANRFSRAIMEFVDGELLDDLTTVVVQRSDLGV